MQASSFSSCDKRATDDTDLITNRQTVAATRIGRAEPPAGLLLDHDPFRVTEITQFPKRVPARSQRALRVTRKSGRLTDQFIRQPLMVNPRRVDRLLDIHVVVNQI